MSIFSHALRQQRALIVSTCAAGMVSGLGMTALIHLINTRLVRTSRVDLSGWWFVAVLGGVFAASLAAKFTLNRLSGQVVYEFRERIVRGVLLAPYARIEAIGDSRIYATLTEDIEAIASAFSLVPSLLFSATLVCGGLLYLIALSPVHFLVVAAIVGAAIVLSVVVRRRADLLLRQIRTRKDELFAAFESMLFGKKELELNRRRCVGFYSRYVREIANPLRDETVRVRHYFAIMEEIVGVSVLAAIGAAIFNVELATAIGKASVSGFVVTILFIHGPIRTLVDGARSLLQCRVSVRNITGLGIWNDQNISEPERATQINAGDCLDRVLELRGVTYRYSAHPGQRDDSDAFTLGPIDLSIRSGEVVFIVGGNGSGKSTLAKIITGLYQQMDGKVLLDDSCITAASREWYCDQFAAVFSDFHLFDDVLDREGRAPDDDLIREMLQTLKVGHLVAVRQGRLLRGTLSTGQAKRLAFLVARMEDKPLYVFDEWAAEQDPHFRTFFYSTLLLELKNANKAVICITHDDRYLHMADRVLRMENGVLCPMTDENWKGDPCSRSSKSPHSTV